MLTDNRPELIATCRTLLQGIVATTSEEKAQELLAQVVSLVIRFNIPLDDVLPATGKTETSYAVHIEHLKTRYDTQHDLAMLTCQTHYFVRAYHNNVTVSFFGESHNLALADEVFNKLLGAFHYHWQMHRLKHCYSGRQERRRKSFIQGIYERVNERLTQRQQEKVRLPVLQIGAEGRSIILVEKPIIECAKPALVSLEAAFVEDVPNLRPGKYRTTYRETVDYQDGYKVGGYVRLPGLEIENSL